MEHSVQPRPDDGPPSAPSDPAAADDVSAGHDLGAGETEVLERLEHDLAAVEEAMSGLDRIDVAAVGSEAAAAQVSAIVDGTRFAVDG